MAPITFGALFLIGNKGIIVGKCLRGIQKRINKKPPQHVAVFRWHLATVYVLTVGELGPHKCLASITNMDEDFKKLGIMKICLKIRLSGLAQSSCGSAALSFANFTS